MIKKAIISLFFVFFQLDNFCFSQIQYNIFKNQNEGIVQWTDESQSPVEIQLDNNIATLRGNPEDSFFFVIHEGTSEEKEVITVNFALDESCVKLSYTDESNELEDKELKLGEFGFSVIDDSIHDLLDFWVDNQKEKFVKLSSVFPYRIKITRQNNHKLVLIFAPGGNGELLSFAHFSIQSTMHPSQSTRKQSKKAKMLPNKNRNKNKNKKKKEKKRTKRKEKASEQAVLIAEIKVEREQEAPITISPPPPPPQPERIPTSAKPLATLKSSDEKAPKAESRGPATPTKMISSTDLGLQLKLLSPVAKRQLKPKEQSKDPTEQLRGVVEGVISARREKVGDSDSEDESAWSSSDEAVTNTALTYNSFVNIRAQESEAPLNTKKTLNDGIDTDDDADDEVFKDEDDDFLEDFTFISGGNVYEKPLPAPDFLLNSMVLSHEEQNISDKDKKKKVKFSGFKKAVQVLSGTSKKEKKQKEETNTFNPVYVPNVPNHETQANVQPTRRLSVTHMRSLFEAAPLPNITSTQKQVSEIKPGGNIEAKPDMLKPGILKHGILKPWSSVKKADTSVSQARPNPSLGRPLPVIRTEESVTRSSSVKDLKRLFEGQVEPTIKAPEVKAEVKHSVGSRHQGQKMSRTISLYGLPNYARDESEDGLQEEQDELDSFYAAKQPRSSKVVKSVSTSKKPGTEKGGTATTTLRQRFVNRFGPKEKLD